MEPFQVRLNCVDHYQATPSEFDPPLPYRDGAVGKYDKSKVPVIRIFGATETGQKVCVHVHGAFPYLYIEYDGPLNAEQDHALALNYRRNAYDKKTAFVAHITLVKGVPFYGYHVGYRFFFKIYLLNPVYVTRLADLLLQGAVLKRPFQPYESHLQYVPQWMCDYNLYGCAYMKCSKAKFRSRIPELFELTDLSYRWHDRSIPPDCISDAAVLPKQSHCSLEVDVCVQDILNRVDIKERPLHQDFTEMLKPVTQNERLVPSMAGLWQDETRRRKRRMGLDDFGSSPFGPEELMSLSAEPRSNSEGGWIHEEEFRQLASQIVAEERKDSDGDMTPDKFLKDNPFEKTVKTALESVEDFFPDKIEHTQMEMRQSLIANGEDEEAEVNENAVLSAETDMSLEGSADYYFSDLFSEEIEAEEAGDEVDQCSEDGFSNMIFPGFPLGSPANPSDGQFNDEAIGEETEIFKRRLKRSQSESGEIAGEAPYKRLRFLENNASRSSDRHLSMQVADLRVANDDPAPVKKVLPQATPPSSQQNVRTRINGEDGKLNFPVVKDPNDPMTIVRFSQDGVCSSKGMQELDSLATSESHGSAPKMTSESDPSSQLPSSSSGTESTSSSTHVSELIPKLYDAFSISDQTKVCCWRYLPPSASEVSSTLAEYGYPYVVYTKAHYSNDRDVPDRARDYAGRTFRLEGNSIHYLPQFDPSGRSPAMYGEQASVFKDRYQQEQIDQQLRESSTSRVWEFAPVPPSRAEVMEWFEKEQSQQKTQTISSKEQASEPLSKPNALSQIEGPTQKNDYGFKYSQKGKSTSVEHHTQYMSSMSLEVHVNTRGVLLPNPEEDEISCIFWCIQSDGEDIDPNGILPGVHVGMIAQGNDHEPNISKALRIELDYEPTELDLINRLVDIVRYHDPDIITGYEVHNSSWGYLIERARKKYDFDLCDELSRVKSQAHGRFGKEADRWGFNHTSSIRVTGRHMINIWRSMRGELNLLQYTMENVVYHLLHRRIPHYSFRDLTAWYESGKPRNLLKVVEYFVSRIQMNLEILDSNELIPRTSEQARLLGIDFFSVFSRGSQFKVESLMFRIAKPENFLLVSPSRKQVGQQNALECLPLVMEPQSDFYTSPLLVLDFQSLYPSIMIAYNYCYSTFLGRARQWRGRNKMGFMDYKRQPRVLELLKDKINIAPNGMMYVKQEVRQSLLARMLAEILETRVMVKTGMKMDKDDKVLQRLLNNRQLALKLIANVTYGYTSASFSGRMPCSEIADSIVQSGRETLEKAIALIHSVERWGAEVVYGDTDSLFVYLKGRTRDEAFNIGEEIAKTVTDMNPHPVKLKFEKVYHPCVLLAKKRYVGFKYEHRDQKEPEFDAKGIETVRRDGTPAEQKIEEKALKLLFRTADLSQVKQYFQKQCAKILQGRVSIQDFCFAKEVRLGTYSERGLLPPGAMISTKKMVEDPRSEPQYGERVPYVVVTGAPGSRLVDRCVAPEALLHDAQLELDAEYYITKNLIPPLERIFNLVGANVRQWYEEMPKFQRIRRVEGATTSAGKDARKTLESYMKSSSCIVCKSKLDDTGVPVCSDCLLQPHISLLSLVSRQQQAEKKNSDLHRVCRSCMGIPPGDEVTCNSKDCPVFYSRTRHLANWKHTRACLEPIINLLQDQSQSALEW
ncbi:DNA-directed DNA polymerase zeta catalytic subunit REV3 [Aspergillus clavatus NRRL 1]|uniref:DNA polymerase n=1 Tax=Aspergillus clavatus (strain ATCC 1007 / CBS 513.65 / DSM 816 / NCTC 3887 / NRRL 1 / QM 1276 / 107) TaxID=344612 RepID=A1CJE8_ASPCL|nr:DNA polymerase zeta catalytic subunit, putative [Aspergillus clavatus NRRL 1]EAW09272.1 DNA polymerase zeta catalytic subunit, putative [Aspergillus clavatus NRRL 1]